MNSLTEPIRTIITLSATQIVKPMYHPDDITWKSYLAFIKTRFGFYDMYKQTKKEG